MWLLWFGLLRIVRSVWSSVSIFLTFPGLVSAEIIDPGHRIQKQIFNISELVVLRLDLVPLIYFIFTNSKSH